MSRWSKRLREGTRGSLLERIRLRHDVEDRDGELVAVARWDTIGSDVFRFVQALIEVSDLTNLDRESWANGVQDDLGRGWPATVASRPTWRRRAALVESYAYDSDSRLKRFRQ